MLLYRWMVSTLTTALAASPTSMSYATTTVLLTYLHLAACLDPRFVDMVTEPSSRGVLSVAVIFWLVPCMGYTYTERQGRHVWRCSVRGPGHICPATVLKRGDVCIPGAVPHDHPGTPGVAEVIRDKLAIHAQKKANPFKSTQSIAVSNNLSYIVPFDCYLTIRLLIYDNTWIHMKWFFSGECHQKELWSSGAICISLKTYQWSAKDCPPPPDPHDLRFIIVSHWIPRGFLRCDTTTMPGVRHLIFATDEQIEVLRSAHTLWVDATFKLVKGPFYQLFFCARVYLWEQWWTYQTGNLSSW